MNERTTVWLMGQDKVVMEPLSELSTQQFLPLDLTGLGEEAIERAMNFTPPDLAVIAIDPDANAGFELSSKLRLQLPHLPIVFVSRQASTDEILRSFDAGGQDFIQLPLEKALLNKRLLRVMEQARELSRLHNEKHQVTQMAMSAMGNAADIGIILNFVREGIRLPSQRLLVQRIVKTISEFGLAGLAQVRAGDEFWNGSTAGQVAALEAQVLERSALMEQRIIQHGSRLIINYDHVTLLIKNQPIDNPGREGELRDFLTILAENANDLIKKIRDDLAVAEQRVCLVLDALRDAQTALSDIQAFQAQYKSDSMLLLDQLVLEIEEEFQRLELTHGQEQALSEVVQRKLNEALELTETGLNLDDQLKRITENLGELTRSF